MKFFFERLFLRLARAVPQNGESPLPLFPESPLLAQGPAERFLSFISIDLFAFFEKFLVGHFVKGLVPFIVQVDDPQAFALGIPHCGFRPAAVGFVRISVCVR